MEPRESGTTGHKCSNKEPVKEKMSLQRKWASEPANPKQSTFADLEAKKQESLPSGATGGLPPQQKYDFTGNPGKMLSVSIGAMGSSASPDPQGPFAQGFPRGYSYQLGQPYPQHPQSERFLSGAKPQPGLEPHAWPFAGQLPSEELYSVGHPVHTHPHGACSGRFPRQKSPSLPSSFDKYPQSGSEPAEEGYSKKDHKPKKPGKYICHYCGRACAKPSVLKKHIRSHTGERPYPCIPCGFSFKTKSNLYKHRKSHAHAIKAGIVPFTELPVARSGDMDHASLIGETEVHSDGDQSTDTDEEGMDGSTMMMDKNSGIPQISFEVDRSAGSVEPAYADSAEDLPAGSMKVPILIVPKPGGVPSAGLECPPFQDIKGSHHMLASQAGRAHSLDDSPTIKQRLALRLNDKKGQALESVMSQSLNLLSPHSKGSTDSGYFSRSESAEQQISPPNSNIKTYEEIMFGRTWYYRPNSRSRQSITVGMAGAGPGALGSLKHPGAVLKIGKMGEDHICFRGDLGVPGEPKQNPTGPCQSSTGLLEPPSESGLLIRTNSLPSSSPSNLSVPTGIRGSHSFDEMMTSNDVFYPPRRLTRQTAFEHPSNETHVVEAEGYGLIPKNVASSLVMKIGERSPAGPEHIAFGPYGTKISLSEIATRKRRKEKSVGDEEDSPGNGDSSCSGSVEMIGDYEFKHGSFDGSRATPTGKGSLQSADSFDTCASMGSEDIALFADSEGRKSGGNVISVIQHTNSLSRPNSFEKSESFEQPGYQASDKAPSSQFSEQSDTDIFEDALSPESALLRTEGMDPQPQSDSDQASLSSSSAAASPGQPYHIPHKLVRQPNIQVPEIRVTEEPDKPEKDTEAPLTKEPEKQQQHVEDFQLPQRSDTLSQMPSEKLPPKKKRLRLTDMEHSSGESSFESTCTSLSRSPSQESNLSHSSSFSMSFDRDEGLKSISPTKQDEAAVFSGPKQSEFLTVPGSGHASHQQREMRRSSSEQAPCTLLPELTDIRSKSFDCGSLPSSRQGEIYCSASAMKERRRGYLVRQPSLSVYPEAVAQDPGLSELSIKKERVEHGAWHASAESSHGSSDLSCRAKRGVSSIGGVGAYQQHHQPFLQQSTSEDSLQDQPLHSSRSEQHRLQSQTLSSEGEHPGHELMKKELVQQYQSGSSFLSFQQTGLAWSQEVNQTSRQQPSPQTQQQLQKLQIRSSGSLPGPPASKQVLHSLPHPHERQRHDGKSEIPNSQTYSASFSSRASPQSQQQQLNFASASLKNSHPFSTTPPLLQQQIQPVFATQNLGSQTSVPGVLVPVRIQTHVPTFGSVMYTSVSQLVTTKGSWPQGLMSVRSGMAENIPADTVNAGKASGGGGGGAGFNLLHFLAQTDGAALCHPRWKSPNSASEQQLSTGIPLSLTSGTMSTTDASGSGVGGGKRMLSPTSSLERFMETKQQKRVKEERMYGQILKEMSAVELSGPDRRSSSEKLPGREQPGHLQDEDSMDDSVKMTSSAPLGFLPAATKIAVPVRSSAPHLPDVPRPESFTPPLQIVTERFPASGGWVTPEEPCVDDLEGEPNGNPQSTMTSNDKEADRTKQDVLSKPTVSMLVQIAANQSSGLSRLGQTLLVTDVADVQQFFQFPSLRTMSSVSWCFLNYTKPNSSHAAVHSSVYSSWCVSSYNPNPLNLSTKATLALLRSKQRRSSDLIYTPATISPPSSGKLVSSVAWKLRFDQVRASMRRRSGESPVVTICSSVPQLKPELMPFDVSHFGRKGKGVASWEHSKEEQEEKETSAKQPGTEPSRIKIFEGGYKSNEDYVYVRGRGRGKYICEECGIRCKKPSMLKKHIRTHTDVRPYVCKFCNFAFKTKGNLTKHMKSKAHMKKCLELGVSMSSVEDNEADEGDVGEEGQRAERSSRGALMEHQFSDAEDSEGAEEDGDDVDDDDDDEEDYDGDSTPKTRSRSTSPQPYSLPSLSITAVASSQPHPHLACDLIGNNKPPFFGYFTTVPSIQITPQAPPTDPAGRVGGGGPPSSNSSCMDEDFPVPSPDLSYASSRLSSPALDHSSCPSPISPSSSPSAHRYLSLHPDPHAGHLSPRRDLSPLRHISPKRDLGVAGGYRRDLSPRRGPLSLLSPAGRDYKRDLSPRGRHRGLIRPVSPRRGLYNHLRHHSPQSRSRTLRLGHQADQDPVGHHRGSTDMETNHSDLPLPWKQDQDSPPPQVLFSHLPLHSQKQVHSPFPMIPIGGIQMVHSLPTSVPTPLSQHGALLVSHLELQNSPSEDSSTSEATFPQAEGGRESQGSQPSSQGGGGAGGGADEGAGAQLEQEENIHTCTKAIASLCLHSEERSERGGRGARTSSSPPALSPDSQPHQCSPPPPPPPPPHSSPSPPQHFTGLELRSPYPPASTPPHTSICAHPLSTPSENPHRSTAPKSQKPERDGEEESTRRLREAP